MSTTTAAPRRASSPSLPTQTKRPSISDITGKGSGLPNRYILHAVEGWGKTSFGAQTPKPVFLQIGGETGLETLIDAGRLPEVPHLPALHSWEELLGAIDMLTAEEHAFRTLVVDTVNGSEGLCHQHVCTRDFGGNWTPSGFTSYSKGYEVSLPEWQAYLNKLDRLRIERKMTIFLLCHTKVKPFKNPLGADYDRYQPDCHEKTWGLTHKWADVVLFGNFEVTVDAIQKNEKTGVARGKGTGGNCRIMYCERSAAYDAKNRMGLPAEIEMGDSPASAWTNFMSAVKAGRELPKVEGE